MYVNKNIFYLDKVIQKNYLYNKVKRTLNQIHIEHARGALAETESGT